MPGLHLPHRGHEPRHNDTPTAVELAAGPSLAVALARESVQRATPTAAAKPSRGVSGLAAASRGAASANEWKQVHEVDAVVPAPGGEVGVRLKAGSKPSERTKEEKIADCAAHGPNVDWTLKRIPFADNQGPCRSDPGNPVFTDTNNALIGAQQ